MSTMVSSDSQSACPSYCLTYCDQSCIYQTLELQFTLSTAFSVLTILVSAYHIYMHLHNFNNPFFQSKIIGILFINVRQSIINEVILIMAPFYCITSMGSFIFPNLEIYFTLTRDSYQAVLLFVFFYLMFSYLAYDRDKVYSVLWQDTMEDRKVYTIMIQYEKEVHHFCPFSYCQKPYQLTHWKKAKYFTYRCKKYVLQFLVVKLFTTLLMYIIYPNETTQSHLGESQSSEEHSTYAFISGLVSWIVAISASYSLYYLVLFYHALHKPLAPYAALLKFLTIKITIFFTFWQRIVIVMFQEEFLSCFNQKAPNYDSHQIVSSLENTLICFEMLMMSIAGGIAYDYENYVSERVANEGHFSHVLKDTVRAFKNDFRLIKPKKFGFTSQSRITEIEMVDIKLTSRQSVMVSIKNNKSIADSMVEDYL